MSRATVVLTIGVAYLVVLAGRRLRRWQTQRELRVIEALIAVKGQQQRFTGFAPELRQASAQRRAMAETVKREARHIDSGGEPDMRRRLRAVS